MEGYWLKGGLLLFGTFFNKHQAYFAIVNFNIVSLSSNFNWICYKNFTKHYGNWVKQIFILFQRHALSPTLRQGLSHENTNALYWGSHELLKPEAWRWNGLNWTNNSIIATKDIQCASIQVKLGKMHDVVLSYTCE